MQANIAEHKRWNDAKWTEVWPKRERFTNHVTPVLLDALRLQAGERVLDIGCGGGNTTIAAALKVGASGTAIGADISVELTALASRRSQQADVGNIAFNVADIQTDTVAGGPFDVAMSQFGVMFFDEPSVAFANIARHLRRGGRLGFACWQPAQHNLWHFAAALVGIAPPPPVPAVGKSATGPFSLAEPELVRQILGGAGFQNITIVPHEITVEVPEDAVVDDVQFVLAGVPPQAMDAARTDVGHYMAQFRQPSGLSRIKIAFQVVCALRT